MWFTSILVGALLLQWPEVPIPELAKQLYESLNSQRAAARVPRLPWDTHLAEIARAYSETMAAKDFFSHTDPQGRNSRQRVRADGYVCSGRFGENLAATYVYSRVTTRGNSKSYDWYSLKDIASNTVSLWMKSTGHRENILDRRYNRTGLGVAVDKQGKVYITQLFCGSKGK